MGIVGAPDAEAGQSDHRGGAAYIFNVETGTDIHRLEQPYTGINDDFGAAAVIVGDRVVVGAPRADGASGRAYVFDVTTGELLSPISAPGSGGAFGWSVDLSGRTAIIGAFGVDKGSRSYVGAAYLFDVTTGLQLAKLSPSDGRARDLFGWSVAISGNRAIVGSREDNNYGSNAGSVYVYDATTGDELFKLPHTDRADSHHFGTSLAMSGYIAVVGAPGDGERGWQSGAAYVFDVRTGVQLARLEPSDGAEGDKFGESVAIRDGCIVVGSPWDDREGSVYVYEEPEGGWADMTQTSKIVPGRPANSQDSYGLSVSVSGDYLLAGAPQYLGHSGMARVYHATGSSTQPPVVEL